MSETFREAYSVLQKHAQTLRKQSEPNIDDLLTIVEESVAAYKVCQTRIDAVEMALAKALGSARTPDGSVSPKAAQEKTFTSKSAADGNSPF